MCDSISFVYPRVSAKIPRALFLLFLLHSEEISNGLFLCVLCVSGVPNPLFFCPSFFGLLIPCGFVHSWLAFLKRFTAVGSTGACRSSPGPGGRDAGW